MGSFEVNFGKLSPEKWSLWAYLMAQVPCKVAYGGPQHGQSLFEGNFGEKIGQEGQNSFKT